MGVWRWALGVLVALGGTAAAHLYVFEPDGWLPVAGVQLTLLGTPLAEAHAFHPTGDPGTRFLVGDVWVPQTPEVAVAAALDELAGDAAVESRTLATRDGRTVGELALTYRSGLAGRIRVAAARSREPAGTELAVGICSGAPAVVAVCAPRLAWVSVEVSAPREDGFPWGTVGWMFGGTIALGVLMGVGRWAMRARAVATSEALREGELVTITGVVRAIGDGVVAPLTGRACVVYRARAQVFTHTAVPAPLGEPHEAAHAPFTIATARGDIVVEAVAELDGAREAIVTRSRERELAFLARHGFARDLHAATTFDELAIVPGATIKIRGVVQLERDPGAADERGFRDDAPTIAKLVPVVGNPLTILAIW